MTDQFEKGYALLVGVDENYAADWALPDVAKDIAALSRVLTHPERCAYPGDQVKVISGQAATRQGILDGLEWLQARVQAAGGDATAIVYYSGHGWRDRSATPAKFYLIPYDIREDKVRARALRAADFAEAVDELRPQRLLVVLDCCHAAGMGVKKVSPLASGYVGAAIPPALLMTGEKAAAGPGAKGLETLAQGQGRAVLSSSTGEQSSYMREDGEMSIFTYHLIEALTGHARPEQGATEVLVSDVMSHVWRHVPRSAQADWGVDQTPDYQVSGNFPIALLLGGQAWSKGQAAPDPLGEIPEAQAIRPSVTAAGARSVAVGGELRDSTIITGDRVFHTGGGAFVGGNVSAGGDFVGRDQVKMVGPGAADIARVFEGLYAAVEAHPDSSPADKADLKAELQDLQAEVLKGNRADEGFLARRLRTIERLAPEILDLVLATLSNPAADFATVVRKVAQKKRESAAGSDL